MREGSRSLDLHELREDADAGIEVWSKDVVPRLVERVVWRRVERWELAARRLADAGASQARLLTAQKPDRSQARDSDESEAEDGEARALHGGTRGRSGRVGLELEERALLARVDHHAA